MANILVPKLFGFAKIIRFCIFSTDFFSDETLHVAYKKNKIKKKFYFFSVNTKYISFRELKTSDLLLVLRARESSDGFNILDRIYLVFTSKKYISSMFYIKYLTMFKVHRHTHAGAIRKLLYGCAFVREIIHSLSEWIISRTNTQPCNNLHLVLGFAQGV